VNDLVLAWRGTVTDAACGFRPTDAGLIHLPSLA
jgi:hypothetical protein